MLDIDSNSSAALPFDKIRNYISFHIEKVVDTKQNQIFKADSLIHNAPSGVTIGKNYTLLRSQLYRAYATIFLEPLMTIKNCLPFPLQLEMHGKRGQASKSTQNILEIQDEIQITDFSPEFSTKIKCTTENFTTNEYVVLPVDKKPSNQSLFFYHQNKKVYLDVHTPVSKIDGTIRLLISARTCVINESMESLDFFACSESATWVSPFSISTKNGNEIVIFDSITAMKVRPKSEGSSISEVIPINRLGVVPIDIFDGKKQILNLGIQLTNVLCGKLIIYIKS